LKRSLTNCPERIFASDTLVGGTGAAGAALTTGIVGDNGACLAVTSFAGLLVAFDRFFSTLVAVGRGTAGLSGCTSGGGSFAIASTNCDGGGTIVGRLVSMTILSGGCCNEAIRMTGLLLFSSAVASVADRGKNQFAASNNTSSDAPTQAMYRPIGITMSAH
jgi:hypothetical protein